MVAENLTLKTERQDIMNTEEKITKLKELKTLYLNQNLVLDDNENPSEENQEIIDVINTSIRSIRALDYLIDDLMLERDRCTDMGLYERETGIIFAIEKLKERSVNAC